MKLHIGNEPGRTFCGKSQLYQTKREDRALVFVSPFACTCLVCLSNYYLHNPLIEKRTHFKPKGRWQKITT